MAEIRLQKICKNFGATRAVDDINCSIAFGEMFFLLGPSGCGKSTVLRMIAGLIEPSAGKIFFDDHDVTQLPTEKRNAVMCFQSYALWPHMTVEQNVRFGLEVQGTSKDEQSQRVAAILKTTRLDELKSRKPGELSGGQQQRVALARALVVQPSALLLDEPLSNLDAKLRVEMRSEIRRLCSESKLTTIYVTHDQREALSIADRIAVMNAGRIEQIGTPREIYRNPCTRFVASFMGDANFLHGKISAINESHKIVETSIGTVTASRLPQDEINSVATLLIRPEAIKLHANSSNAINQFTGTISETTYLGEFAQHRIRIGRDATEIIAAEINPRTLRDQNDSSSMAIQFDPSDVATVIDD